MRWIDGHLDLAYLAVNGRDIAQNCISRSGGCVSLPALREAGVEIAFGTIFTEPAEREDATRPHLYACGEIDSAHRAGLAQLRVYEQLETAGELRIIRRLGDLHASGPCPGVVLLMEGADPIRTPDEAAWWFERGVRIVGMAWAMGTRYAAGNASKGGGMTRIGRELVAAFDDLGIVHDASHLSDEAFDHLATTCAAEARMVATHSNCRTVMGEHNQRHLTDQQITTIAQRDGVVGLNLFAKFLSRSGQATIDDCAKHLEHAAGIMTGANIGESCDERGGVALGSDMDGGFGPESLPIGLDSPQKMSRLAAALVERGWSQEEVEQFAYGRWLRLLEEVLPV